jgi:hypothetical protein
MNIYFYFYATTVNNPTGFMPQNYSHGALRFIMQCNKQIYFFIYFFNADAAK